MAGTLPNIAELSASELGDLIKAAEQRLIELREVEAPALMKKWDDEAKKLGFRDWKSLAAHKSGKRGRGRPRHENGHANT